MKSISPHPHPSSLLPPSTWQPSSRTRASKSTFRAVGACLIIAENQRKQEEEREGGTERIDKHREEGQMKGGRERDRTEGKAARQEISASNPNNAALAPSQQLPSLQTAAAPTQRTPKVPGRTTRHGQAPERYPAGRVHQLRLMAASVAAAPASPDVMHPPSSASWGWSQCSSVT